LQPLCDLNRRQIVVRSRHCQKLDRLARLLGQRDRLAEQLGFI